MPSEFATDRRLVAFGSRIEQPRRLIERGEIRPRIGELGFISGNRRRDLIPFAAQGVRGMHRIKLEQSRSIVKPILDLPGVAVWAGRRKGSKSWLPPTLRSLQLRRRELLTDQRSCP